MYKQEKGELWPVEEMEKLLPEGAQLLFLVDSEEILPSESQKRAWIQRQGILSLSLVEQLPRALQPFGTQLLKRKSPWEWRRLSQSCHMWWIRGHLTNRQES